MRHRVGVIGATGYIGTPYREEIRASSYDVRIVALCARRRDRLEQAGAQDGATCLTDDWREVVHHPDVNLVLVLTPDALHLEPVIACIDSGKHVLCEKPVGMDASQAYTMWQAAHERGIASFVPYWTRYVPIFQRAKQLVDEGRIGDVRAVIYRWHNPRPLGMPFTWRDDATLSAAGSIADVGSHAYDILRYTLGFEAKRVLTHAKVVMPPKEDAGAIDLAEAIALGEQATTATNTLKRKGNVPDYAQIAMEFENGAVGTILLSHASYLRKGFAPELELHGTKASLSIDRIRGELRFSDTPDPARHLKSIHDEISPNRFQAYVFPAFDRRIEGQTSQHPDLYDGWRVQIFTDAAVASAKRDTWTELAEFDVPGDRRDDR